MTAQTPTPTPSRLAGTSTTIDFLIEGFQITTIHVYIHEQGCTRTISHESYQLLLDENFFGQTEEEEESGQTYVWGKCHHQYNFGRRGHGLPLVTHLDAIQVDVDVECGCRDCEQQ